MIKKEKPTTQSADQSTAGWKPALPIDFESINPWKDPEFLLKRRNLPHLQAPAATYFVSFHCQEGITLTEPARDIVLAALRFWDGKRISLDAAVVMPDHAHAIFRIIDKSDLSQIMHRIKSYSSNEANKLMKRKGSLWIPESFDHILRNEEEWLLKMIYIRGNPVKKGLVEKPEDYRWLYCRLPACAGRRLEACSTLK
jgi:REP element-mobilizing transposase RayT